MCEERNKAANDLKYAHSQKTAAEFQNTQNTE